MAALAPPKLAATLKKLATDVRVIAAVLVAIAAVALQLAGVFSPSSPPGTTCTAGPAHLGSCAPNPTSSQRASLLALPASVRTIHGLIGGDFSSYQGAVNWSAYRGAFAFVKASEGRYYVDPQFARSWAALRARHIPHGAYDFARPAPGWSGADEARHFWGVVHAHGGFDSLPPVIDVEASALSPSATRAWVADYLRQIRELTGRHAQIIYSGAWFWDPHVGGPSGQTRLWVSGYANSPTVPRSWAHYTFWQYTDGAFGPFPHSAPGIALRADVSVFNGTEAALRQLAAVPTAAPKRKPSPKPAPKTKRRPTARQRKVWARHHRITHLKLRAHCSPTPARLVGYCAGQRARNRKLHKLLGH